MDSEKTNDITVNLKDVVDYLNSLLKADRRAIQELVSTKVKCNEKLAFHPTVQVIITGPNSYETGVLGVLNGLFGIDEKGDSFIMAVFGENNVLKRFELRSQE